MSKSSHKNSHFDCTTHDKSSRSILPPDLSTVFARIDPIADINPRYSNSVNPHSNQITNPNLMKALPIESFEQWLDRKDLNSIQL